MPRIEHVEAWWLQAPIPPERQHTSDFGRMPDFNTCLVRVTDEDGMAGYGEAKVHVGSGGHYAAVRTTIERELGPAILGQEAGDIHRIWSLLYNGSRAHHATASGRSHPVLGRRGVTISAISGIDIALWDLLGRRTGLPLYQLLGGRSRDRIPAYASGGWGGPRELQEEARRYVREGYGAIKIRAGRGDGSLAESVERIQALRAAAGPGVRLMIDAHGTLSLPEAKQLCRKVEECDLFWFEEPTAIDQPDDLAALRQSTDIPIAAGESEQTRYAFRDLLQKRCLDVAQPDLSICGGISEAREIAALCGAYGVPVAPHMWGGPVLAAAALHFAIAMPGVIIAEQCRGCNPLLDELTGHAFVLEDGCLTPPEGPGIGLVPDMEAAQRFVKEE